MHSLAMVQVTTNEPVFLTLPTVEFAKHLKPVVHMIFKFKSLYLAIVFQLAKHFLFEVG